MEDPQTTNTGSSRQSWLTSQLVASIGLTLAATIALIIYFQITISTQASTIHTLETEVQSLNVAIENVQTIINSSADSPAAKAAKGGMPQPEPSEANMP